MKNNGCHKQIHAQFIFTSHFSEQSRWTIRFVVGSSMLVAQVQLWTESTLKYRPLLESFFFLNWFWLQSDFHLVPCSNPNFSIIRGLRFTVFNLWKRLELFKSAQIDDVIFLWGHCNRYIEKMTNHCIFSRLEIKILENGKIT